MSRLRWVGVLIVSSGVWAIAAPPKKGKPAMPFPIGSEATVVVVGDEVRLLPSLGKATVVMPDSLVLLAESRDNNAAPIANAIDAKADLEYGRAIRASDPDGIRVVISNGWAVRVLAGTRVRVVDVSFLNPGGRMIVANRLPIDRLGKRLVRITEGTATGKLADIPARNLRAIEDDAKKDEPPAKKGPDPAKRAATLLQAAKNLEKLKKPKAALESYRQILADYPASLAAKEAAARVKVLEGK